MFGGSGEVLMGLFTRKPSASNRLADAVAADVADAFDRFVAARGESTVVALALCTVDDAVPPHIMGAVRGDMTDVGGSDDTMGSEPADWSWNDDGHRYRYEAIIAEMLENQPGSFEDHGRDIFAGIAEGLRRFDGSGHFKGELARDQMLLVLWIHDPAEHNAKAVMDWAEKTNSKSVAKWFRQVYSYRS